MSANRDGKVFGIPRSRRLTWDLLHFHRSVPLCGHDRFCNLRAVAEARSASPVRVSWPAIFLKAYAIVAAEIPELRQTWYRWPWAHLYQHPQSVGILTIHREFKGEPWLFWARIPAPEDTPLTEIQAVIDHYAKGPVADLFHRELRLASLPTALRRLFWGWNVNVAKSKRAKRLGTFFLSTLAGKGVEIPVPPSIHTGCLTYGVMNDRYECKVTIAYDHRVMDGSLVAHILQNLECVLLETVCSELLKLSSVHVNMDRLA
ncbi:MAG: hypothetical protein P8J37_15630 [Fuerstiella sp.]|nr:hypothetical protein [Fuerstiella sp.]